VWAMCSAERISSSSSSDDDESKRKRELISAREGRMVWCGRQEYRRARAHTHIYIYEKSSRLNTSRWKY
jgi:hypothetical protein